MVCNERYILIDREGWKMAVCSGDHVEKAIEKGQYVRTTNPNVIQVKG